MKGGVKVTIEPHRHEGGLYAAYSSGLAGLQLILLYHYIF